LRLWKKAVSVVTSAALLASLLTAVTAPAVLGSTTSAGGGTVYPGYAPSPPFSLTFAENAMTQFAPSGSFRVAVLDVDGTDAEATWVTTVAPTVTTNLGLGTATAGFDPVTDELIVSVTGNTATRFDSFTVSGLRVNAASTAEQGALIFPITTDTLGLSNILATATGTTTTAITAGVTTSVTVAVDAWSPPFQVTGTACVGTGSAGSATIAAEGVAPAETFAVATATAPAATQTLTKATPFTATKTVGRAISQTVCAARFPSPVVVGDAVLVWNADGFNPNFEAGVNSQTPAWIRAQLGWFNDLLLAGDSVTFTIQTPGVLFTPDDSLIWNVTSPNIGIGARVLSGDRTAVTVPLTADADALDFIDFRVRMDVALTVPNGTPVNVAVTVSRAGVVVLESPVTVAIVGFVTVGAAAVPTVWIGHNDQATGMITLTESAAGVIGTDQWIEVCLESAENWSVGRNFWAVVTAGNLRLNAAGLPVSQARMTLSGGCLEVQVYSASTVASTIQIRDGTATAPLAAAPTAGPKVNVGLWQTPGPTWVHVYANGDRIAENLVIAVRAYTGTPTARAHAQLPVLRGVINQLTGDITFTEGAPNQFGNYWWLEMCLVRPAVPDTHSYLWSNPVGANAPVVTTNSAVSGLIAIFRPDAWSDRCINLEVLDSGLSGLGTITISNLRLDVKKDAPLGAVFVRVRAVDHWNWTANGPGPGTLVATVSPATVIEKRTLSIRAVSALGRDPAVGFNTRSPKVQVANRWVTWRFSGGDTLANQRVNVLVAHRIRGAWTGPRYLRSAWADANGIVTVMLRRPAGTVLNVRIQWPGDAFHRVSTSRALGAHWR
jgi:hypothetical protein